MQLCFVEAINVIFVRYVKIEKICIGCYQYAAVFAVTDHFLNLEFNHKTECMEIFELNKSSQVTFFNTKYFPYFYQEI